MQAILLEDIRGLGEAGNVVTVARGYMRNYLEPRRLAEVATPAKIAEVQRTAEQRAAARAKAAEEARETADLLGRTVLTLKAKAGADGRCHLRGARCAYRQAPHHGGPANPCRRYLHGARRHG